MALLAIVGSGCTSLDWVAIGGDDVATRRKQRLIEATGRFEKHRDEAQWQAALARLLNGDLDSARSQLIILLTRNPDHADALALLDEIDATGMTASAVPANENSKREAAVQRSEFRRAVAVAAAHTESPAPPMQHATTHLWGIEHNEPQTVVDLAVDALQSNQPDVALDALRDGLARFPDSAVLWRTFGAAHHQKGDFQSAQSALHQALSLDNSSPLAYFLLGQSLRSQGQHEQARRYFQAAADLDGRYAM